MPGKEKQKKSSSSVTNSTKKSLTKSSEIVKKPFSDCKKVSRNVYVSMPAPKPARIDDDSICNCKPSAEGNCGSNECMNRMLHIECNPRSCPCGESCKNQRIRKREHAPLQIVKTESKGNGAICTVDLNPGDLVTEYCGEIIDEKTRDERLLEMEKVGDTRYYFFSIDGQTIIDAGRKGSLARFLNHSCDPNCITEKWDVNGVTRVGIFAKQKIKAGEELTYDYNFLGFWKDGKEHRCNCGSNNCSGLFGKRPLKLSTSSSSGSSDSKKPSSQNSKKSKKQKKKDDLHLPQKISNVKNFSTWIEHLLANEVDPYAQIAESHNIYLTRNRQSGYRSIVDKIRTTQSQSQ